MDFSYTPEQRQLADALRRWLERDYGFEQRKGIIHSEAGISDAAWNTLAELGTTALPVPAEQGGFDGSAIDMMAVMHELGRALVIEPYWSTVVAAECLRRGGTHGALLEQVAAGTLRMACAFHERAARHDLFDIRTTAKQQSGGWVLDGEKTVVLHGAQAGVVIVPARTAGERGSAHGITLFAVPAGTAGVAVRDYRTIDGARAADMLLQGVTLDDAAVIGTVDAGGDLLEATADYGIALLCAEAVGAMEALNAATLDYLKTRQQFGVPIGKFQVLQHRMADMFIHFEQARSMAMLAAAKAQSADAVERRRTVSAAKARIGQAMKFIGQQAIQLHGGMGVTDELPASHYFKRLTMIEVTLGDTDHHLARFAAQDGFMEAA